MPCYATLGLIPLQILLFWNCSSHLQDRGSCELSRRCISTFEDLLRSLYRNRGVVFGDESKKRLLDKLSSYQLYRDDDIELSDSSKVSGLLIFKDCDDSYIRRSPNARLLRISYAASNLMKILQPNTMKELRFLSLSSVSSEFCYKLFDPDFGIIQQLLTLSLECILGSSSSSTAINLSFAHQLKQLKISKVDSAYFAKSEEKDDDGNRMIMVPPNLKNLLIQFGKIDDISFSSLLTTRTLERLELIRLIIDKARYLPKYGHRYLKRLVLSFIDPRASPGRLRYLIFEIAALPSLTHLEEDAASSVFLDMRFLPNLKFLTLEKASFCKCIGEPIIVPPSLKFLKLKDCSTQYPYHSDCDIFTFLLHNSQLSTLIVEGCKSLFVDLRRFRKLSCVHKSRSRRLNYGG